MANTPITLTAEVTDSGYIHLNGAEVTATVTTPSGAIHEVPLEWTVSQDGEYRGTFSATEDGRHEVYVGARRAGSEFGSGVTHFEVGDVAAEFYGAEMQTDVLEQVAQETGGHFYTPETVATLPEDVSFTESGTSVFEERDLWDMPIVFLVLIACLGAEWTFRRYKGLA